MSTNAEPQTSPRMRQAACQWCARRRPANRACLFCGFAAVQSASRYEAMRNAIVPARCRGEGSTLVLVED